MGTERAGPDDIGRLETLARLEAWKARLAASAAPDPVRLAAGWERRFVVETARADEMMALYRELGFDVCADPVDPGELVGDCRGCALVAALRFRTVYTRRPDSADGQTSRPDPTILSRP
jgi:hypothetical protein